MKTSYNAEDTIPNSLVNAELTVKRRKHKNALGKNPTKAWWWVFSKPGNVCCECEQPIPEGEVCAWRRYPEKLTMCDGCVELNNLGVRMTKRVSAFKDEQENKRALARASSGPRVEARASGIDAEADCILTALRDNGRVMSLKDVACAARLPVLTVEGLLPMLVEAGEVLNPRENVYRIAA
jgi:hypothetical protein